ncbi:MAG: hypothetical protein M0Z94_20825 [Dehalococcoidales bacterium]|nr:hypothetical protein [Dehalococcoidales bacterium]
MVKRAPVPEGKSIFFRRPDVGGAGGVENEAEVEAAETKPQTRQSAIFLEERHLDWLDDKCREARKQGGRAVRKAAIIRALIDVGMEAPLDLTNLRDEYDLRERLRRSLRAQP